MISRSQAVRHSLQLSIDPSPYDSHSVSISTSPSPSSTRFSISTSNTTPLDDPENDEVIFPVLCLYDFDANDSSHLSFRKNEILYILQQEESGWWAAVRAEGSDVGWIPKTFVKPLSADMMESLRNVREELRVFEYKAEQLYNAAPTRISRLHMYDVVDPLATAELVPMKSAPVSPKLGPPPTPLTPMPQPPPSTQRYLVRHTPPVPIEEPKDNPFSGSSNHHHHGRSPSEPNRNARRWPVRPDDDGSLSRLSMLMEKNNVTEIEMLGRRVTSGSLEALTKQMPVAKTRDKIKQLTGSDDALAYHMAMQARAQAAWYLRPRYPPEQIIMGNGNIRAGTLQALVEKLIVDRLSVQQEAVFENVFLMTFRTFTTPDKLFDLLMDRYQMDHPADLTCAQIKDWTEKKLLPTQKRVLTVLTMWLVDYALLMEEPHITRRLTDFLSLIVSPPALSLTAKLMLQSLERLTFAVPTVAPLATTVGKRRKARAHKNDLLRLDPADVAEQLCLLEHKLYIKIRQQECLQWADTQTGSSVENLAAFCATHDKLVAWVKMSILESEVIGRRADTIAFWIKAAEKSKNLNNFASMSAMINGLSSTTVSRLNLTWAHVGRRSTLDTLLKYNEPTGSFSGYRGLLQSVEGPCVPFIGMFLTEIVHIGDQFPDNISPTSACASDPFISFQKRHRWHDVVVAMLRYQNRPFHVAENVSTRDFINNHLTLTSTRDQSWFWLRSQELQKIEMTHFDIRQGLEAAGF